MTTPWLAPVPSSSPPLRPRNDVDLTRERLIAVLEHFSQTLVATFAGKPLRLVVHGGACMLLHPMLFNLSSQQHQLHPTLPHRTSTRDVDYVHRSFVTEMSQHGVQNAAEKIKMCIHATAKQFVLGADWMNSDADIALPMATAPNGMSYDPIYYASVQPNNINLHTIFRSTNGMLTLISVTPFWAVSLKLVRYTPQDAADICLLLRNGTVISQVQWTIETLREWLFANCWVMGYASYDKNRLNQLNVRLEHAIKMVNEWGMNLPGPAGDASIGTVNAAQRPHASQSPPPTHLGQSQSMPNFAMPESSWSSVNMPPHQPHLNGGISALAAMGGGGEVVGGEFGRVWNPQYGHEQQRASMTSPQQHHQPNSNPSSNQNSPTGGSNEWGLAQAQKFDFSVVSQKQQQQQRAAAAAASAAKKARRKNAVASTQGDSAAGVNGHRHSSSVASWGSARNPLQDTQQQPMSQQQLVYKHQQEAQRLHQEQMELYQKLQQQSEAPEQQRWSKSFSGMGLEAFDMSSLGRELGKADGQGHGSSASTLPPYLSGQGISSPPPPYPYTHGNYGGAGKAYPYAVPQPSLHAPVVPLGPSLSTSSNSSSLSRKHERDKDKKTKKEREKEERDKERKKKEKREDKERKRERQWRIGEKKEVEVGKWSLKLGLGGFGSGKSDTKKEISPDANGVTLKDSEDYFQKHLEVPIHIVSHTHPGKELGVYDEDSGSSEEEDSDSEDELPPGARPFPRYTHQKDQTPRYSEGNSDYTDDDSEDEESDDDTERGGPGFEGWTGQATLQAPPTLYNAPPPASAPPAFHTASSGHATRVFPPPPSAPPTQGLPNGSSTYPGMVASAYPPQASSHHPHQSSGNGAASTYPGQDLIASYPPQSTYPSGASTYPGQSATAVTAYHPPQPGTRPNSPQRQSANLSSSFGHSASMPSIYLSNGAGANGHSPGSAGDGAPGYNLGIAPATESRSRKSSTLGTFSPPGVARSEDLVPIPPVPTPIPAAQIEYERERAEREKKREKKEKEKRKKEKEKGKRRREEEEAEEPFIPPVTVTSDPSFRASLGHQPLGQAAHPHQQQQQQGHVGSPHSHLGAPAAHAPAQAPPPVQHRQYLTQSVQESSTGHARRLSQQVYPQQGQIPALQSSAMYQQMNYQQQKPPSSMDTRSRASMSGPSYEDRQRSYSGGAQGQTSSAPAQGMGLGFGQQQQQHLWQSPMHSQSYQPQTRQPIYPQH